VQKEIKIDQILCKKKMGLCEAVCCKLKGLFQTSAKKRQDDHLANKMIEMEKQIKKLEQLEKRSPLEESVLRRLKHEMRLLRASDEDI
jgi:hypothetical protein